MSKIVKCKSCSADIDSSIKFCPQCGAKNKKPLYKKWWFWIIVLLVIIAIGITNNNDKTNNKTVKTNSKAQITVSDFSEMSMNEITAWADINNINVNFTEEYSDTVEKDKVISQSTVAGEQIPEGSTIKIVISKGLKPSIEYLNALKKAELYSDTMYMSKQAIYNQLISPYGEKFPKDAAQYAIDNLKADYNANALEKAKTYQISMNMSKSAIYNQLVSEYGEKFTAEEAQYAIDHLDD